MCMLTGARVGERARPHVLSKISISTMQLVQTPPQYHQAAPSHRCRISQEELVTSSASAPRWVSRTAAHGLFPGVPSAQPVREIAPASGPRQKEPITDVRIHDLRHTLRLPAVSAARVFAG